MMNNCGVFARRKQIYRDCVFVVIANGGSRVAIRFLFVGIADCRADNTPHPSIKIDTCLACRLGRCFGIAEVSTGHPHPQGEGMARNDILFFVNYRFS